MISFGPNSIRWNINYALSFIDIGLYRKKWNCIVKQKKELKIVYMGISAFIMTVRLHC